MQITSIVDFSSALSLSMEFHISWWKCVGEKAWSKQQDEMQINFPTQQSKWKWDVEVWCGNERKSISNIEIEFVTESIFHFPFSAFHTLFTRITPKLNVLEGTRTFAKLLRYFLSNFLNFPNFIYNHLALRWTSQEENEERRRGKSIFLFVFNLKSSSSCCSLLLYHLSPIFPISRNFEQTNKVSWEIFAKISMVDMIFSCDFHSNFPPWWTREKQV